VTPDTQLPRFEVFEQERPGQPHRSAGSVHAPDLEMALLNARDVFVRRPACDSLWIAPASAIYSRTAEELDTKIAPTAPLGEPPQTYHVFAKPTQRQAETFVTHIGAVEARSPAEALSLARGQFAAQPAFVWWIVPDLAILRSDPAEAESLFAPAADKPYRSPNFYHTLTQMRAVRAEAAAAPSGQTAPPTAPHSSSRTDP
jgi:ring-1,2-phenylacetyl-CoA epoxidase subunit PaaB